MKASAFANARPTMSIRCPTSSIWNARCDAIAVPLTYGFLVPPGVVRTVVMPHRRFLTRTEAEAIEARVAAVEAATGAQVVVALIGKADAYVELPWKAFAL